MTEPMTVYKLMVLYLLKKVDFALTNVQLSDFFLDKQYTDYFTLQLAINELLSARLIRVETMRDVSRYELTKEGEEVLNYFGDRILSEAKLDMDQYLKDNHFRLKNENSVLADYTKKPQGNEYEVSCQVREGKNMLIELKLSALTEEMAARMCDKWSEKSADIYEYIIRALL